MLISLIYYMVISFLQAMLNIRYKKWDLDTCTPADYTIQMSISNEQYKNYQEGLKNGTYKQELHDLIADSLEDKIKSLNAVFENGESTSI